MLVVVALIFINKFKGQDEENINDIFIVIFTSLILGLVIFVALKRFKENIKRNFDC